MRKRILILLTAISLLGLNYCLVPFLLPKLFAWWQPEIVFRGDAAHKILYLTIDDAPTTETEEILAVLAKHKVPATFFIISGRVKSDPELRTIVAAGHRLGLFLFGGPTCARKRRSGDGRHS